MYFRYLCSSQFRFTLIHIKEVHRVMEIPLWIVISTHLLPRENVFYFVILVLADALITNYLGETNLHTILLSRFFWGWKLLAFCLSQVAIKGTCESRDFISRLGAQFSFFFFFLVYKLGTCVH